MSCAALAAILSIGAVAISHARDAKVNQAKVARKLVLVPFSSSMIHGAAKRQPVQPQMRL